MKTHPEDADTRSTNLSYRSSLNLDLSSWFLAWLIAKIIMRIAWQHLIDYGAHALTGSSSRVWFLSNFVNLSLTNALQNDEKKTKQRARGRWNRTTVLLNTYRFEVCTPHQWRSSTHIINIRNNNSNRQKELNQHLLLQIGIIILIKQTLWNH